MPPPGAESTARRTPGQLGASEADLLRSYPRLHAEDLVHAWGYYQSHREEIDRQIRENEAA